jgi:hypothetical protein
MDFLRRLVTRPESDASRAVGILPPRFVRASPLATKRSTPAVNEDVEVGVSTPSEENFSTNSSEQLSVERASRKFAARESIPRAITNLETYNSRSSQHQDRTTTAPHIPIQSVSRTDPPLAESFAALNDRSESTLRANQREVASSFMQSRMASPLSDHVVAERTLLKREEDQIVHVTIGRIDVVANTSPAPAAPVRRNAGPKHGTLSLADYLRGSKGARL